MTCGSNSAAVKVYQRGIALTMSVYVLVVLGVKLYFKWCQPHGVWAYLLAVLPAVPIVWMLVVVGIYLRDEKDEFQRWMTIKAMLWATGVILAVATIVGFLESFTSFKSPAGYYVLVVYWLVFGAVHVVLQWQSRRSDD